MKCIVCKRRIKQNNYYSICNTCYPSWKKGFEQGKELIKAYILSAIEGAYWKINN